MSDTPNETPEADENVEPSAPEMNNPQGEGGASETAHATSTVKDSELHQPERGSDEKALDLDFILDIPLTVTVEVGRTKLLIEELLQLGQGAVIELDKLMGEPFEVMVNEKLVARGEIVVVNDRFGVRLTDIISPSDRVQTLA